MIKVFGYLKRKPGLSPQEFAEYYEHNHVPLVLSKAFNPCANGLQAQLHPAWGRVQHRR